MPFWVPFLGKIQTPDLAIFANANALNSNIVDNFPLLMTYLFISV